MYWVEAGGPLLQNCETHGVCACKYYAIKEGCHDGILNLKYSNLRNININILDHQEKPQYRRLNMIYFKWTPSYADNWFVFWMVVVLSG